MQQNYFGISAGASDIKGMREELSDFGLQPPYQALVLSRDRNWGEMFEGLKGPQFLNSGGPNSNS